MFTGKKDILASWLCNPFFSTFVKKYSSGECLRILAYHRVVDYDEKTYPFDEDLISASVKSFEEQLQFVSDNFTVITFQDATRFFESGQAFPLNPLVITFDDGYADNYYNAFALLKKHGLRAVFYLATDNIGTHQPFWFEKIAYLGKKGLLDASLKGFDNAFESGLADSYVAEDWTDLRSFLIKSENQERVRLLGRIEDYCQQKISSSEMNLILPMTWEQVAEMSRAGMEIGSHTKSHLVLGMGTFAEISEELRESKEIIENKIASSVCSVSYPIASHSFAINKTVLDLAAETGYEWGVSYFSGADCVPAMDDSTAKHSLRRLKVERYTSTARFAAQLFFPSFFSY